MTFRRVRDWAGDAGGGGIAFGTGASTIEKERVVQVAIYVI